MKKLFIIATISLTLLITPSVVSAQSMMGRSTETISDGHTAREEAEGKEIWEQLQSKQLECQSLTDENYGSLGEYFMGQTAGSSHEAMNNIMKQMMGEKREQQMHILIGKRSSGCDTSASGVGIIPMMGMMQIMRGGGNHMMGYWGNNMMGGWGGFGLGWISMIIFWLILILGVVALIKWLISSTKTDASKTPLDILKERFAKGEIEKKEFEEKVKVLTRHEGKD